MVSIFHPVAQDTITVRITMTPLYLIVRRQPIPSQLPNEDANFEGAGRLPNILSMRNRGTLDHSLIERFG
jgi:hypothetical protein